MQYAIAFQQNYQDIRNKSLYKMKSLKAHYKYLHILNVYHKPFILFIHKTFGNMVYLTLNKL